jgi:hypothetical protein
MNVGILESKEDLHEITRVDFLVECSHPQNSHRLDSLSSLIGNDGSSEGLEHLLSLLQNDEYPLIRQLLLAHPKYSLHDEKPEVYRKQILEDPTGMIRALALARYANLSKESEKDFVWYCDLINDVAWQVREQALLCLLKLNEFDNELLVKQALEKIKFTEDFSDNGCGALILALEDEYETVRVFGVNAIVHFSLQYRDICAMSFPLLLYSCTDESEYVRRRCLKGLVAIYQKHKILFKLDLEKSDLVLPMCCDENRDIRKLVRMFLENTTIDNPTVLVRMLRALGKNILLYPGEEIAVYDMMRRFLSQADYGEMIRNLVPTLLKIERFKLPQEQRIEEPPYRIVAYSLLYYRKELHNILPDYLLKKHLVYFEPFLQKKIIYPTEIIHTYNLLKQRFEAGGDVDFLIKNISFYQELYEDSELKVLLQYLMAQISSSVPIELFRFENEMPSQRISAEINPVNIYSGTIKVQLNNFKVSNSVPLSQVHLLILNRQLELEWLCEPAHYWKIDTNSFLLLFYFNHNAPSEVIDNRKGEWLCVGWFHNNQRYLTLTSELLPFPRSNGL